MEALAMRLLGFYERQGELIIWGCGISRADVIICADKDIKRYKKYKRYKKKANARCAQGMANDPVWQEYESTCNNADCRISSSESIAWHTVTAQLVME